MGEILIKKLIINKRFYLFTEIFRRSTRIETFNRLPTKIENLNRLPTKLLNFNRQPASGLPHSDPLVSQMKKGKSKRPHLELRIVLVQTVKQRRLIKENDGVKCAYPNIIIQKFINGKSRSIFCTLWAWSLRTTYSILWVYALRATIVTFTKLLVSLVEQK